MNRLKRSIFWETDLRRRCMKIWEKVFKNEPSKICGRQSLKNLKGYGLPKAD